MKNCNSILKFNKYIVNKVYLVNNENYKEDKNGTQVKFAIEPTVENDGQKMTLTLIVDMFKNAIAILYPYVRALISTYTANANINPLILPAINVNKLIENSEDKKD